MSVEDLKNFDRRKKYRVVLSLDEKDKEIFLKKLEMEGVTAQKFLYTKIFKDEIKNTRDYLELSYQIRKIGLTLYQYLKLINNGKSVQDEKILKALEEVTEVLENFKKEV